MFMVSSLVLSQLFICFGFSSTDAIPTMAGLSDIQEWMKRFENDPFLTEEHHLADKGVLRTAPIALRELIDDSSSFVFKTRLRLIPVRQIILLAMYRLLRRHGILQQEGFDFSGWITVHNDADVLLSRAFRDANTLLKVITNSVSYRLSDQQVAVGLIGENKPMPVLTNYLLTSEEVLRLKKWLRQIANNKSFKLRHYLARAKLHVIVYYSCCYEAFHPSLRPRYAKLFVKVG